MHRPATEIDTKIFIEKLKIILDNYINTCYYISVKNNNTQTKEKG